MPRASWIALLTMLVGVASAGAAEFAGLTPGRSTAADAKKVFGDPTQAGPPMHFSGDKYAASDIRVDLEETTGIIQAITLTLSEPPALADMTNWLHLAEPDFRERAGDDAVQRFLPQLLQLRVRGDRVTEMVHLSPKLMASLCKLPDSPPALSTAGRGDSRSPRPAAAPSTAAMDSTAPGWLGFRLGGRFVSRVFENTTAAQAGVQEGDEIVEIDGNLLVSAAQIRQALSMIAPGRDSFVKVVRAGQTLELQMASINRDAYFEKAKATGSDLDAAIALAECGRLSEAEKALRQVAADGHSPRAQYELAQVAERINYRRGIDEWRKFLAQAGADPPEVPATWPTHAREELKLLDEGLGGYLRMDQAMDEQKYDDALLLYSLRQPVPVESSDYYFHRGYCLKKQGKYADAVKAFQIASMLRQHDAMSWYHLAECYEPYVLAQAQAAGARYLATTAPSGSTKDLRTATEQRKDRLDAALKHKAQGDQLVKASRWQDALKEYETAAASAPRSAELLLCRARMLAKLGRSAEMVKLCQSVSEMGLTPTAAAVHTFLGDEYYRDQYYALAADQYAAASETAPEITFYLYKRALAAEKAWVKPLAALAWQGYLAQSEDDPAEADRRNDAQKHLTQLQP